MYKNIRWQHTEPIHQVILARPDMRNAFQPEMIAELTTVFKEITKSQTVRGVILAGEGTSFCAGADLAWMQSMAKYSRAQNIEDSQKLYDMFAAMRDCPVPIVGKIQGHAMGGALGLISVCDVVLSEAQTKFCFSEAKLGLSPAVISVFIKEKMNKADMRRYFLTAEIFSAYQAQASGLVNIVLDSREELDMETEKIMEALLANGPQAVRTTKKLLHKLKEPMAESAQKTLTTELIADLRVSAEGQEGLTSFFEKREPSWRRS